MGNNHHIASALNLEFSSEQNLRAVFQDHLLMRYSTLINTLKHCGTYKRRKAEAKLERRYQEPELGKSEKICYNQKSKLQSVQDVMMSKIRL